jgi:hypothetical protein
VLIVSILVFIGYIQITNMRTDTTAPVIEMETSEIAVSVKDPEPALLQGISAYDAQDGDVFHSVIIESIYGMTEDHRATVTYAAFDKAGNVAKAQRQVHYTDYRSPRFTLSAAPVFEFGDNFDIMEIVGADDVIEGNIQRRVKATIMSKTTTISKEGIHDVQFRVTNSMGDSADIILPVEVYASDTFDSVLTLTNYLIYVSKGETVNPKSYLNKFTYVSETIDLITENNPNLEITVTGSVNTNVPGVYPISYLAEYNLNNRVHTAYTKLIVVVEG